VDQLDTAELTDESSEWGLGWTGCWVMHPGAWRSGIRSGQRRKHSAVAAAAVLLVDTGARLVLADVAGAGLTPEAGQPQLLSTQVAGYHPSRRADLAPETRTGHWFELTRNSLAEIRWFARS
jgi:hypothetical protein